MREKEDEGGSQLWAEPEAGTQPRKRGDLAGRKLGSAGVGLTRVGGARAAALCAAAGRRGRPRTRAVPGHGEQGAAAPCLFSQPQEDEASAGHRAVRLRRL